MAACDRGGTGRVVALGSGRRGCNLGARTRGKQEATGHTKTAHAHNSGRTAPWRAGFGFTRGVRLKGGQFGCDSGDSAGGNSGPGNPYYNVPGNRQLGHMMANPKAPQAPQPLGHACGPTLSLDCPISGVCGPAPTKLCAKATRA